MENGDSIGIRECIRNGYIIHPFKHKTKLGSSIAIRISLFYLLSCIERSEPKIEIDKALIWFVCMGDNLLKLANGYHSTRWFVLMYEMYFNAWLKRSVKHSKRGIIAMQLKSWFKKCHIRSHFYPSIFSYWVISSLRTWKSHWKLVFTTC